MIRHIVTWNYADGFSADENRENARKVQAELESLKECIAGIIELKVIIEVLPSGNTDVMLTSLFESVEALAAYQIHPEHVRASTFVGSVMKNRRCTDYRE